MIHSQEVKEKIKETRYKLLKACGSAIQDIIKEHDKFALNMPEITYVTFIFDDVMEFGLEEPTRILRDVEIK